MSDTPIKYLNTDQTFNIINNFLNGDITIDGRRRQNKLTWGKVNTVECSTLTYLSLDQVDGTVFKLNVTCNTIIAFFAPIGSDLYSKSVTFSLMLINGGSKTVTWDNKIKWIGGVKPTLTASGTDILTFTTFGGDVWYCINAALDLK